MAIEKLKRAFIELGNHFISTGRFTKASSHFNQGVIFFKSMNNTSAALIMQYNLALTYLKIINFNFSPTMSYVFPIMEDSNSNFQETLNKGFIFFFFFFFSFSFFLLFFLIKFEQK